MSRTVIINGREYPVELYSIARELEIGDGAFADRLEALRKFMAEPPRPDVGAAVRAGIAAAALEPTPRNRRERRVQAAQRRKAGGV